MVRTSPCLCCTRVKDPANCNNKNCIQWQIWFAESWEAARRQLRANMDKGSEPPKGVVIGGRSYIPPNQLHYYLEHDPCQGCPFRQTLCKEHCRTRLSWQAAREEIGL